MASAMTGAYVRTAELRMLEATISGVRGNGYMLGFHEVGGGEGRDQARLYPGEPARAMKYHCNFDPSHGACLRRPTGQLPGECSAGSLTVISPAQLNYAS
uniref:Uncharacterized protein n=1 Tax=Aegilops tauschii subsp. strangulata TaxID=200361 RepID=A0A453AA44_AEGTS